ncbi:MAG: S8 family serine peptidase, partial [Myxococcota bacterium]|nr:S8 family serine peptidase [Myxococcota bacterium]
MRPAPWTRAALLLVLALALFPASAAGNPGPGRLIVKFKSEGPAALDQCAETLFRQQRSFAQGSRAGSASLDAVHARAGVRRIRALFRRPDGQPLAAQRARLQQRLRARSPARRSGFARRPAADPLPDLSHVYLVEIAEESDTRAALALYGEDPHVSWVQRDHTHQLDALGEPLPNDPFLHSSGSWQQAFADLWGLHRVRAPEAWGRARGEGVVVAVVDSGLDYEHPDIAENVWINPGEDVDGNGRVDPGDWNGIDDDGNGFIDDLRGFDFANSVDGDLDGFYDGPLDVGDPDPFDDLGHGTHVAGTIAAVANNGIGIAGVAPGARIMALKGFSAEGEGRDSDLWRAVLYAADNGARVINNSWSCSPLCPVNPLAEEIVRTVHAMGVVIVTSAGNRKVDVVSNSPENMRQVITVASSGEDDRPSQTFTNFGWLVDLAAPGGGPTDRNVYVARRNILSLRSSADEGSAPFAVGQGYMRSAGTSMAAPHVAGAAAILLSAYPGAGYETVRRLLRQGAADLGPPGHDFDMGAGRLDVVGALESFPLPAMTAALDGPRPGSVFRPGPPAAGVAEDERGEREEEEDSDEEQDENDDRRGRRRGRGGHHRPPPMPERSFVDILGTAAGPSMREYRLSVGRGNEPAAWSPIAPATGAGVAGDVLGRWDITDADEGTYVVRLEVEAWDGTIYREFIPLSLERNTFAAISSPGPPALRPDLDGRFVAWQSLRTADPLPETSENWNLFVSDVRSGRQWVLEDGPDQAQNPSVSWGRSAPDLRRGQRGRSALVASWSATSPGSFVPRGFACRLNRARGACPPIPLDPSLQVAISPVSAQGRIFWLAPGAGGDQIVRGCLPDPASTECLPYDLRLPSARRGALASDGRSLSWLEFDAGQRVGFCRVDAKTGECPARLLPDPISPFSRVTVSGDLVAWVDFRVGQDGPLLICEFDAATGACPPV